AITFDTWVIVPKIFKRDHQQILLIDFFFKRGGVDYRICLRYCYIDTEFTRIGSILYEYKPIKL
ncbi:MAG: hypothetical protein ACJAYV_002272, partial [Oleispira sp.]